MSAMGEKIDGKFAGGISLWAGIYAAVYVKKRGWLWFIIGTILGFIAVLFATLLGGLYRGIGA